MKKQNNIFTKQEREEQKIMNAWRKGKIDNQTVEEKLAKLRKSGK